MTAHMTTEECRIATKALSRSLDAYADLVVRSGAAVQPGQELVVSAPVERGDFVRRVVRSAYAAGASHVTTIWHDDEVTRLTYQSVDLPYFQHVPAWQVAQLNGLAEMGASFLFLEGTDPAAFDGIDPAKPAAAARARNTECRSFRDGMDFGRNQWSIAGVPVEGWSRTLFPGVSTEEATYRTWVAILQAARADGEDPQADWETHDATFERNKRFLNEDRFDSLRYRSANGTDLTVGLNPGHVWEGGSARTQGGVSYFPNIPTEEVFTTPDRLRVEGLVHSAMPLVHAGHVVDDFWLRFEGGAVVDFDAARGKEVLRHVLDTDEGARRLGECALISKNTPIRQSGRLFYSTLFDENASCHLALGMGFPECLEGGVDMGKDDLLAHGVNQSATHVDFMVGADDLSVVGVTASGEETDVFVNGQWAWETE